MSYNLFLDDFRLPKDCFMYTGNKVYNLIDDWIIVRNYDEFINMIKIKGIPDLVSFDHDLSENHYEEQYNINYDDFEEKTGYHCAKWLIKYCIDNNNKLPQDILIHSMNPAGSKNIESLFQSYYKSL